MKVHLHPTGLHSRAMVRVATALVAHAPKHLQFVTDPKAADLRVLHVIGADIEPILPGQEQVIIQYCYKTAGGTPEFWHEQWAASRLVWSYYDLPAYDDVRHYTSPLGIDPVFRSYDGNGHFRPIGVMTSGYVTGKPAEAIEEPAVAADETGCRTLHIGPPRVEGMRVYPPKWAALLNIDDEMLAALYGQTEWVSCLRYVEGFEMPAIEGLACGARPIVFDRPDMQRWYEGHAVMLPECDGDDLVSELSSILRYHPAEVTAAERRAVLEKFDWARIVTGFWERVL